MKKIYKGIISLIPSYLTFNFLVSQILKILSMIFDVKSSMCACPFEEEITECSCITYFLLGQEVNGSILHLILLIISALLAIGVFLLTYFLLGKIKKK